MPVVGREMVNLYNPKIQIEVICILIKVWRERLFLNAGFLSTFFFNDKQSGAICYTVHGTGCSIYPNLMMCCDLKLFDSLFNETRATS